MLDMTHNMTIMYHDLSGTIGLQDPEACRRLYEDSIRIVNEKIPVQIQPADKVPSGNGLKDDAVNASYTAAETL